MYGAYIRGVGAYVPERRLTNRDLEELVETSDDWIQARTGILERRIVNADQATSDLAYEAAKSALAHAKLDPQDVDLILVATETPDHVFPPVACQVQHRLGCGPIGALDLHATCVGFISALQVAEQFIKAGTHRNVLVIGADTLSRWTDYTDRTTCILFSDGAGAFVVSRAESDRDAGIVTTSIHADGSHYDALYVPGGGSRHPHPIDAATKGKIVMDGRRIFKLAVRAMSDGVQEALTKTDVSAEDVDWLIPHQANQRIIDAVVEHLDFDESKVISTVSHFGNNSSATLPLAIHTAIEDGRIQRGQTLCMVAFGAGLVWGSALVRY